MIKRHTIVAGMIVTAMGTQLLSGASAGVYSSRALVEAPASQADPVQYWRGGPGWHGGPGVRRGRPYWFARPWARRPYYGTVIAGVALGALVTVAVVGAVPPRPAPNLCWYWADPYRSRGYWDYCY